MINKRWTIYETVFFHDPPLHGLKKAPELPCQAAVGRCKRACNLTRSGGYNAGYGVKYHITIFLWQWMIYQL